MATDRFSWKGLFINDEEDNKEEKSNHSKEFPKNATTVKKTTQFPVQEQTSGINNQILESVLKMYETGFESLNLPGYDFYEFFKSIMAIDPDNQQTYIMAFTMAQSMDSNLSKEILLSKADFYIAEINKVHNNYELQGKKKQTEIIRVQQNEKKDLENQIQSLQQQIEKLQNELKTKSILLDRVDSKYAPKIVEVADKLSANNAAKDTMINTIDKVVNGIKNHIK